MLGPHVEGVRVVVRRLLPGEVGPSGGPAMTDVLGTCEEWTETDLAVRTEAGELVRIPRELVVSGKPVPPRASVLLRVPAARLHRAGLAMWPHVTAEHLGDWVLRHAADGSARRANSALALGDPGLGPDEAVGRVRDFYAARERPAVVCVADGSAAQAAFADAGWGEHRPGEDRTLVQVASVAQAGRALRERAPDLDGTLTEDGPRLHARLDGAEGRAALDGDWIGLHAIATDPAYRRRGLGGAVVRLLLERGAELGARSAYLQVHETNVAALALYERIGFVTHHAYRYLAAPLP